jgi:hypothetical protein
MPETLLCVHRGGDDDTSMYWCRGDVSDYGGNITWSGDTRIMGGNAQANQGVSMAVFKGTIYIAYCNNSQQVMVAYWNPSSRDFVNLNAVTTCSECTPALYAASDGYLYIVYQGQGSDDMYYERSSNPKAGGWQGNVFGRDNQMASRAALVEYNGRLRCFHRGQTTGFKGSSNPDNPALYFCSWDGHNWSVDQKLPNQAASNAGPSAIMWNDRMYVCYRGRNPYNGSERAMYTSQLTMNGEDENDSLVAFGDEYKSGNDSEVGPTLVTANNLFCIHRGGGDDQVLKWTRLDQNNGQWLPDQNFPGNRSAYEVGVSLVTGLF